MVADQIKYRMIPDGYLRINTVPWSKTVVEVQLRSYPNRSGFMAVCDVPGISNALYDARATRDR